MPDDVTLRSRRSRRHARGDHSLCRPERCAALSGKQPASVPQPPPNRLVATYQRELERAGRLDTSEGEHVMTLARSLAMPGHTASALAVLSRELRAAMADALQGVPRKADALDELAARRERKLA